jgi:transcriptional regulator with XRE-family HTH domain
MPVLEKELDREKVLCLMRQKGWTQRDLAKASNVSESCISKIVRGERSGTYGHILAKLSASLDVSMEDLLIDKSLLLSS